MKKMFVLALMSMVMLGASAQAQVVNTDAVQTDPEATKMCPDTVTPDGEWQKVVETTLTA